MRSTASSVRSARPKRGYLRSCCPLTNDITSLGESVSLTSDMKDELARAIITTPSEVAAEVSATLRFAGGLHLVGGRILVEAELDSPVAARRRCFRFLPAPGQALRRARRPQGRRACTHDRPGRLHAPTRARASPRPRRVGHSRSLSHLAWCIPCSRLPHGTRTLLFPRNHVPWSRGRSRDGRLCTQARGSCSLEGSTRYRPRVRPRFGRNRNPDFRNGGTSDL